MCSSTCKNNFCIGKIINIFVENFKSKQIHAECFNNIALEKNFENTDLKKYWSCNHNIYGFRNNLEKVY